MLLTKPEVELTPMTARLARIRHVALDLDGTVYRGSTMFPFTNPFLALLAKLEIGYSFLTNNSSKSVKDYLAHLSEMGIAAAEGQIVTSTQAALSYLRHEEPAVRRLFVLGTRSMAAEIEAAGFALTLDDAGDEPDAVLVGFDTGLTFARLGRAAYWIQHGKPFIATHPDRICPTDQPILLPDCGAICAALSTAAGRGPDAVLGKPDPRMLQTVQRRLGFEAAEFAMVGDRLYTDIEMARRAGALGVLTLSGEATAADAAHAQPPPDLVVADLAEFGSLLLAARGVSIP